jgi:lipoprotein-anchoring transpeptidase ErfK/SrfK
MIVSPSRARRSIAGASANWLGRATATSIAVVLLSVAVGCAPAHVPPPEPVAKVPEQVFPHLVLKLGERKVYLIEKAGTPGEAFPVAVGRHPWPTPVGKFEIFDMVENPDFIVFDWNNPEKMHRRIPPGPNNPLGLRWIGFANAYGWEIGFHGTTKPELLGQAVSHGCVRMKNADVVKLFAKVKIGTPVTVEP